MPPSLSQVPITALRTPPRRASAWLRGVTLILLVVLGVGACTGHRLAYKRADWLASWRLSQYVDLNSSQEQRFDSEFRRLWDWHRATELPIYASELRELAAATGGPRVTPEQLAAWADRAEANVRRMIDRALPPSCALMADFSDAQRDSLLARLDRDQEKRIEEYLEPADAKLRERAQKRLRRSVERWTGRLEASQIEELKQWSQTRPLNYADWIAGRQQFRDGLAAVLDRREAPEFCSALHGLFAPADAASPKVAEDRARERAWFEFLAQFSTTLSEEQRAHLRDQLLELAEDLDQLHSAA